MAIENEFKNKSTTMTGKIIANSSSTSSTSTSSIPAPMFSSALTTASSKSSMGSQQQSLLTTNHHHHLQSPHSPESSSLSAVTLTSATCVPVCSTGDGATSDYHNHYLGMNSNVPSTNGNGISTGNANGHSSSTGSGNNNCKDTPIMAPGAISGTVLSTGIMLNKSETSSNASVNGSIKKAISSNTLMNSREDITSLCGTSSLNSHQSITPSNITYKGTKENPIHNFCNEAQTRNMRENGDDDGLGPLPPKWETAYTERGELYFIDHNTGTSHWLDPRLSKFQKKSLEDCGDNELPYGWEKINDAHYGTYYIDHVNRRTQYENPVLEAKRRAAEQANQQQQISGMQGPNNENGRQTMLPYKFTRNPAEMKGERVTTTLLKSSRGLGITIVGGDDNIEEFLQIKSIVPNGPAWLDGQLRTGDILVYVNDTCVLGFTHHEMVNVFQSILPGETVTLEVCRGYPLPFDPNDPNTEVVTTIAVDGITSTAEKNRILMDLNMDGNYNFLDMSDTPGAVGSNRTTNASGINDNYMGNDFILMKKPEILTLSIAKGGMGFGFTIADSAQGQKVKKILDRNCCKNLHEGDILLEINNIPVSHMSHCDVVKVLKDCPKTESTSLKIQRGACTLNSSNISGRTSVSSGRFRKPNGSGKDTIDSVLFRSKTPTADLYSTQPKEILPIRPKTPLVDTRRARVKTPSNELNEEVEAVTNGLEKQAEDNKSIAPDAKSTNSLQEIDSINNDIPFMDPYPKLVTSLSERLAEASLLNDNHSNHYHIDPNTLTSPEYGYNSIYDGVPVPQEPYDGLTSQQNGDALNGGGLYSPPMAIMAPVPTYHQDPCYCYECQDYRRYKYPQHASGQGFYHQHQNHQNGRVQKRVNELMTDRRKGGFSPLENHRPGMPEHHQQHQNLMQVHPQMWNYMVPAANTVPRHLDEDEFDLSEVTLERQAQGFGFRIVGGTEEGSQVTVGHVVPGGAADGDLRIATGDEILSIDGVNVVNASHHKVVSLMGEAALRGHVTMILRRRVRHASAPVPMRPVRYPYDVIVSRHESEGFGFVIISSNQFYGSTIGKLIPGSPADRCGELKVGDRIIAVNRIDIAGMSHGDIVNLIKESGLHVRLTIGSPKDENPLLNPPQSSPVLPQLKSDTPTYFDRSHINQYPQL